MTEKHRQLPFFGHLFESGRIPYYYDVPSQEIIALDPALAAVLPHFDSCCRGDIPEDLRTAVPLGKIRQAVKTVEEAGRRDGLFSKQRPTLIPASVPQETTDQYASKLQHLILTLTENCNLRCSYCLHGADLGWVRSHGDKTMNRRTALSATRYFLDRCQQDEPPAVSFYGGEPLLQTDLIETVIQEVRNHPLGTDAHLVIDTNGVLLDDATIEMVVRNRMHLQISLDGPRPYHDRQRRDIRKRGTFKRIMRALSRLLEIAPGAHKRLNLICTVAPPVNLMELDEFFSEFPPFRLNGIEAEPELRVNLANLNGQDWPASSEDFQDLNKQLAVVRESYFRAVEANRRDRIGPVTRALVEPGLFRLHHRSRDPLGETYTPGGNCRPGIRKLHVTVDGRFQPCERTGDMLQLGDVGAGIDSTAVQNLQGEFFRVLHERCTNCWALRLCGVCYAAWAEHGNTEGQDAFLPESLCGSVRRRTEEDMKLLVRILELPAYSRSYLDEVLLV